MVQIKHKVTIKTKTAQEETPIAVDSQTVTIRKKKPEQSPPPSDPNPPLPEPEDKKSKTKLYAAAFAGLLVLAGGGYYLSQQGDESDAPIAEVIEPAKSAEVTGGEATDANQEELSPTDANDEVAENTSNEAAEGGAPAQPGQSQDDATPVNNDTPAPVADAPLRNEPSTGGTISRTNSNPTANVTGTVEEEAREVIRGKYGNGDVRKRNLGDRYAEIQSKVNEMYRNGQVL